ncbi:MAG: Gfo/Idh/MocA family oxidoreductase [Actinomyces sp.]|uniref:Gfo/Idh/MocA family oxidoreductase n=1 Tax=Actinomyces sp. TaxID=29317 RepID=UPI0026DB4130|nr:Gfo/Idh/MocA family oxidoreductase [Actinomyces sp.]MDO4242474.1 Gfo/Idh/MocA family oxidoreductase [Actinomyces sp.]
MGRAHLARIHNDLAGARIAAVADINAEAARSAAEPYGATAYTYSAELIADPEVDAVIIATFGKVHAPRHAPRDFAALRPPPGPAGPRGQDRLGHASRR